MRSDKIYVSLCLCSVLSGMVKWCLQDYQVRCLKCRENLCTDASPPGDAQDDVWPLCPWTKGGSVRQTDFEILPDGLMDTRHTVGAQKQCQIEMRKWVVLEVLQGTQLITGHWLSPQPLP